MIDLAENFRPETIEYHSEVKVCPHCAQKFLPSFAHNVGGNSTFQYKTIISPIYQKYDEILDTAEQILPDVPNKPVGKRRGIRKAKERNLFERHQKFKVQALAFVNDFTIPFDNNCAERSVCMLKVVQKINGGWRYLTAAQIQLAFMSFLDTLRKKGQNILETPKIYIPAE